MISTAPIKDSHITPAADTMKLYAGNRSIPTITDLPRQHVRREDCHFGNARAAAICGRCAFKFLFVFAAKRMLLKGGVGLCD